MKTNALIKGSAIVVGLSFWVALLVSGPVAGAKNFDEKPNQVLEWNQIFINTLIATNTANSSSPRVGAIVHTAIFDAYNGIEQRYTPIFVHNEAPHRASRRAAVVAAAYTAWAGLFPSQKPALDASYAASLAALSDDCDEAGQGSRRHSCTRRMKRIERGHPSLNGAAATVLLSYFRRRQQTFTLTTTGQPSRTYTSIARARSDGNNARVWGGMHYPSTVAISDALGEAIANYVNQNSMQRR